MYTNDLGTCSKSFNVSPRLLGSNISRVHGSLASRTVAACCSDRSERKKGHSTDGRGAVVAVAYTECCRTTAPRILRPRRFYRRRMAFVRIVVQIVRSADYVRCSLFVVRCRSSTRTTNPFFGIHERAANNEQRTGIFEVDALNISGELRYD